MLNKKEFINVVSGTTGKSKKEVESAVDLVLEGIKYAYKYYDGVKFVGFGTFKKRQRNHEWVQIQTHLNELKSSQMCYQNSFREQN